MTAPLLHHPWREQTATGAGIAAPGRDQHPRPAGARTRLRDQRPGLPPGCPAIEGPGRGVPGVATHPDPALTSAAGGPGSAPPASPAPAAAPRPRPAPPSAPPPPCKAHRSKHRAGPGPARPGSGPLPLTFARGPQATSARPRPRCCSRRLRLRFPSALPGPAGGACPRAEKAGAAPGLRVPGGSRVPLRRSPEGTEQGSSCARCACPARAGQRWGFPAGPGEAAFPSAAAGASVSFLPSLRALGHRRPVPQCQVPGLSWDQDRNRICSPQPWQWSGPSTQSPRH